jgi:hypothetical protein
VTQNELPFLELDFAANPVDYIGGLDIDQNGMTVIVTFVGGATTTFTLETTAGLGDSAEFFGIYRNDLPRITRIQFDASVDGTWGLDNLEYGRVSEPASVALLGLGLAAIGFVPRGGMNRRKRVPVARFTWTEKSSAR